MVYLLKTNKQKTKSLLNERFYMKLFIKFNKIFIKSIYIFSQLPFRIMNIVNNVPQTISSSIFSIWELDIRKPEF